MTTASKTLLKAEGLVKEFQVRRSGRFLAQKSVFRAVDDVSFAVHRAETLGVVGESGSGKSTSARLAVKLLSLTAGRLEFDGQDITNLDAAATRAFRQHVQVVFQDPYASLNPRQTAWELISAPLRYQGRQVEGGYRNRARELMERVGLNPDWSGRYPRQFSGGQAQRIGIARAIAVDPALVVCDEAVSALDVSVQAQILDLLKELQRESGFAYLFISHDLAVVRQMAHWVVVMKDGKVVEQGTRDDIFDNPQADYTRQLLTAIPQVPAEWEEARARNAGPQDQEE